jgi:hypothetical protein
MNEDITERPKIAICLFGQMRTFERCYPHLERNIISNYDTDIFIHTWRKRGGTWKENGNEKQAKKVVTEEDLEQLYAPEVVEIEEFQDEYYYSLEGNEVPKSITEVGEFHRGLLPMFYKMNSAISIKNKYEERQSTSYDLVLVRPDVAILEGLSEYIRTNSNVLWTQQRSPYRIDDKFLISSPANIDYVVSIWNKLEEYWHSEIEIDYGEMGIPGGYTVDDFVHMGVPERLLHYHLKQSLIDTLPHEIRCTPPVRVDDMVTRTRSGHLIKDAPVIAKQAKNIIKREGFVELLIRGLRGFQ